MAFKGMDSRFQANIKKIYGHGSTRDGGPGGQKNKQPFLEWKPNDPNRNETAGDSRTFPVGSVKRDLARVGHFLTSGAGLLFLVKQQTLQLGNVFTETRILNPLFVVANVVPGIHARRPLTGQASFAARGNSAHRSDAALDPKIGGAGRLQVGTSKAAVANVVGSSGIRGLLGLLPHSHIVDAITGIFSLKDAGSLAVDKRPELDVNGEYFSVLLWKGFRRNYGPKAQLEAAAANLRVGNFKGAYNALKQAVKGATSSLPGRLGSVLNNSAIRIDGRTDPGTEGRRYFITSDKDADRYLMNSIEIGTTLDGYETEIATTHFLDRRPYVVPTKAVGAPAFASFGNTQVSIKAGGGMNQLVSRTTSAARQLGRKIGGAVRHAVPDIHLNLGPINNLASISSNLADALKGLVPEQASDNPGETNMLFGGLSLRQRYTSDDRIEFIRAQLKAQQDRSFAYWKTQPNVTGMESQSPIRTGQENNIDPRRRSGGRYLHDKMNDVDVLLNSGVNEVGDATIQRVKNQNGQDLVNVFFFDFVNKRTVPFRAYLSNISERVNPEHYNTQYIGRTERNIVYVGVARELVFQLRVHAFNDAELEKIWNKINYMTGLCFPAKYDKGFMVPPFVKLTLGDFYRDQPGLISSLSHTIEDNVSWEITPGVQVPHGVTMNVCFSVIEKAQLSTEHLTDAKNYKFYPLTEPRAPQRFSSALDFSSLALR